MSNIEIKITKIADDAYPIWLGFELIDIHGVTHNFVDKAPVILSESEVIPEIFPITTKLKCKIVESFESYVVVDTSVPFGISTLDGKSIFEISPTAIYDA